MDKIEDFDVNHEDVIMKLFVQSLVGSAREWFSFLSYHSIYSWKSFESTFIETYGEFICEYSLLVDLVGIHIGKEELVNAFNLIFGTTLKRIPKKCRPHDALSLVIYLAAFDSKMGYLLRDKEPQNLHHAF